MRPRFRSQGADAGFGAAFGGGLHDAVHLLPIEALAFLPGSLVGGLLAVELGKVLAQLAAAGGGVDAVPVHVLAASREQGNGEAVAVPPLDPPQLALAVDRHP